ncbi:MAG: hypothetical protein IPK82_08175 [Polyangiaceae bacterium]|nr:hypothetical protein [Polyangiaceae bacterium]
MLDEQYFRHEVAIFTLGVDFFGDSTAADVVRVTFDRIPGGVRGTVVYTDANGVSGEADVATRTSSDLSAACELVARTAALYASMHLPLPQPEEPEKLTAPSTTTEPAAKTAFVDPIPPPEPPFTPSTPTRWLPMDVTISLSTALLMTAGFSADVGPALQIGAGIRRDWFSFELEVRGVFPARAVASEQLNPAVPLSAVSFDISQFGAQSVPCIHFATYFGACGVIGGGTYISQTSDTTLLPQWHIGPRFRAEIPFAERFAVFGFAEALFFPLGATVTFSEFPGQPNTPGNLWRTSVVSGFFGVGASVDFK